MLVIAAAALHPHLSYWTETAGITAGATKVVAFNGENSSPTTGMVLDGQGHRAKSLAGYLLFHLGGAEALHQFQEGDERLTDPGADEFRRLIGHQPTVIMIDELVHYINKVRQRIDSGDQISLEGALSTVSALAAAVSSCPNAVLIITSPEDAHELLSEQGAASQGDAYQAVGVTRGSDASRLLGSIRWSASVIPSLRSSRRSTQRDRTARLHRLPCSVKFRREELLVGQGDPVLSGHHVVRQAFQGIPCQGLVLPGA